MEQKWDDYIEIKETIVDDGLNSEIEGILCSIADCGNKPVCKGMCSMHYMRKRNGKILLGPNKRPRRTYESKLEYWRRYSELYKLLYK